MPVDDNEQLRVQIVSKRMVCARWDPVVTVVDGDGGSVSSGGEWITAGCSLAGNSTTLSVEARTIECQCDRLGLVSVLFQEDDRTNLTLCQLGSKTLFGNILFFVFLVLFGTLFLVATLQLSRLVRALGCGGNHVMTALLILLIAHCVFRAGLCAFLYFLESQSWRDAIPWKVVVATTGAPYILFTWNIFLVLKVSASIYHTTRVGYRRNPFDMFQNVIIISVAAVSMLLLLLLVHVGGGTNEDRSRLLTIVGSATLTLLLAAVAAGTHIYVHTIR
jgi:hypothetical protein